MTVRIDPTVGRIVNFYSTADLGWGDHTDVHDKPRAAIVADVLGPDHVNLGVFDRFGTSHPMPSVRLLQDGEKHADTEGHWAEWMPYQKGQAAKTEALQANAGREPQPDWPPMISARDILDGEQHRGSTGQLFKAQGGRWVRVPEVRGMEGAGQMRSEPSRAETISGVDPRSVPHGGIGAAAAPNRPKPLAPDAEIHADKSLTD